MESTKTELFKGTDAMALWKRSDLLAAERRRA
jgi:hypothetical protein